MNTTPLVDTLNRPLHDLRISVIDRCNFRCTYCMPDKETKSHDFLEKEEWLSFDNIERLVTCFVQLGVKKVRLTGGEPLLRPNLSELIAKLNMIKGIEDLALTTNASLLDKHAHTLFKAGLKRITVSLDTLDSRLFRSMSGNRGSLNKALYGIKAAEEAGFKKIKINAVIQRGVNESSILKLAEHFRNTGHIVRFIEYMDVGNCNHWQSRYVVPSKEIHDMIHAHFPLVDEASNYYGEVAQRYRYADGGGEVGFVSSVTQPFCQSCTRARLSANGELFTCLFAQNGVDLKPFLNNQEDNTRLVSAISKVWKLRSDRYSELRSQPSRDEKTAEKIEMFQIGG